MLGHLEDSISGKKLKLEKYLNTINLSLNINLEVDSILLSSRMPHINLKGINPYYVNFQATFDQDSLKDYLSINDMQSLLLSFTESCINGHDKKLPLIVHLAEDLNFNGVLLHYSIKVNTMNSQGHPICYTVFFHFLGGHLLDEELKDNEIEKKTKENYFVKLNLVDQDGKPIPNQPVKVTFSDNTIKRGKTDNEGNVKLNGPSSGQCELVFTNLDESLFLGNVSNIEIEGVNHTVKENEYLALIARNYGTSSNKIWNHSKNKRIRNNRGDSSHEVFPGDIIYIPGISTKIHQIETGTDNNFSIKLDPIKNIEKEKVVDIVFLPQTGEFFAVTEKNYDELQSQYDDFYKIMKDYHNLLKSKENSSQGFFEDEDIRKEKEKVFSKSSLGKAKDLTEIIWGGTKSGTRISFHRKSDLPKMIFLKKLTTYELNQRDKKNSKAMKDKSKRDLDNIDMKTFRKKMGEDLLEKVSKRPEVSCTLLKGKIKEGNLFDLGNNEVYYNLFDPDGRKSKEGILSATVGASWLRYTTQYDVKANLKSIRDFQLTGSVSASVDLVKVQGEIKGSFPNKKGLHIELKNNNNGQKFDLGHWRFDLVLEGLAGVHAHAMLSAEVNVGLEKKENKHGVNTYLNKSEFKGGPASGKLKGSFFAGVSTEGSVSGKVLWQNPEEDLKWSSFAEITWGVCVSAGLGLNADMSIGIDEIGRFCVLFKVGATLGVGSTGKFQAIVGVNTVGSFLSFLYDSSVKSNFDFEQYFDEEAKKLYLYIIRKFFIQDPLVSGFIEIGKKLTNLIPNILKSFEDWTKEENDYYVKKFSEKSEEINEFFSSLNQDHSPKSKDEADLYLKEKIELTNQILEKKNGIIPLLPMGKAMLLQELSHRPKIWDASWGSSEEKRQEAMLHIFNSCENENEKKACVLQMDTKKSFTENIFRLRSFIDNPSRSCRPLDEWEKFEQLINELSNSNSKKTQDTSDPTKSGVMNNLV